MNKLKTLFLSLIIGLAIGIVVLAFSGPSANPPSSDALPPMRLQTATPGTQQTGNFSISGTALVGGNIGIGTTGPNALLDVRKSLTTDVVNNLSLFGYGGTYSNRSIGIQQIGNISTANQFIFLNGGLGSLSVTGIPTLTSIYAPSFGIESNDSNLNLITAAAGTNVVVTRALSINSTGNVGIGTTTPGGPLEVFAGGASAFKLNADGILTLPKQSSVWVYANASQTISSGGVEKKVVNLANKMWDYQSEWDITNNRFVAKTAGIYLIIFKAYFIDPSAFNIYIYRDGVMRHTKTSSSYTSNMFLDLVVLDTLSAGTVIEFYVYQASGVDRTLWMHDPRYGSIFITKLL